MTLMRPEAGTQVGDDRWVISPPEALLEDPAESISRSQPLLMISRYLVSGPAKSQIFRQKVVCQWFALSLRKYIMFGCKGAPFVLATTHKAAAE